MEGSGPTQAVATLGQELLDALPGNAAVVDGDGRIVAVNRGWTAFSRDNGGDALLTSPPVRYADACRVDATDDSATVSLSGLQRVLDGDLDRFEHDYPCHGPDQERWFHLVVTRLDSGGALVMHLDVTAEHQRSATLIDASPVAILELDANGGALHANPEWTRLTGRSLADSTGSRWLDAIDPKDRHLLRVAVRTVSRERRPLDAEARVRTEHSVRRLRFIGRPYSDAHGVLRRYVVSAVDVTEERERADELAHRAGHDELTGMPTRALFREHADAALARVRRPGPHDRGVAVLFLDLDSFKAVNDRFGHASGDVVLRIVAGRIHDALRPEDIVARYGGDEFVVLLARVESPAVAREVAARMIAAIKEPIGLPAAGEVTVAASIGVAFTVEAEDVDAIIERADAALYTAKADASTQMVGPVGS